MDRVVVATGVDALGVHAVKGEILRLRTERPVVSRTTRAQVGGSPVYAVPREDGEIVLGATSELRTDTRVTVEGVHDLLRRGLAILPALRDAELVEATARLRPGTADNLPLIGWRDGLLVAAGHHRNGVLLAPMTANAIASLVAAGDVPAEVTACDPSRLENA